MRTADTPSQTIATTTGPSSLSATAKCIASSFRRRPAPVPLTGHLAEVLFHVIPVGFHVILARCDPGGRKTGRIRPQSR